MEVVKDFYEVEIDFLKGVKNYVKNATKVRGEEEKFQRCL